MQKIIFLGATPVSAKYLPDAIKKLGFEPIFIFNMQKSPAQIQEALKNEICFHANPDNFDDIEKVILKHPTLLTKVIGATSFSDVKIQNACRLAEKLRIKGPDHALLNLIDKHQMQQMVPDLFPITIKFKGNHIPHKELKELLTQRNEEVILKPAISYDAIGILIINHLNISDVERLISESEIDNPQQQTWIAQPRIKGFLYSIEGFVSNGDIHFLGFSKRARVNLTEVANYFPVDNQLSKTLQQKCKTGICELFKKSNFKNGYFHTEFIIKDENCYLIDANLGRIAGGAISEQIAFSFNKTPVELYSHIIDVGLFGNSFLGDKFYLTDVKPRPSLAIHYGLSLEQTFIHLTLPQEKNCFHSQFASSKAIISAIGENDHSIIGSIVGSPENVKEEVKKIQINTINGDYLPFYILDEEINIKI